MIAWAQGTITLSSTELTLKVGGEDQIIDVSPEGTSISINAVNQSNDGGQTWAPVYAPYIDVTIEGSKVIIHPKATGSTGFYLVCNKDGVTKNEFISIYVHPEKTFTALTEEGVEMTFTVTDEAGKECAAVPRCIVPSTTGKVTIPSEANGYKVVKLGPGAFENQKNITELILSDGVRYIEHNYAFSGCINLKSIYISKTVTDMGYALFENCESLTSVIVDPENTVFDSRDNCNAIIHTAKNTMWSACPVTEIPNTVTKLYYAFQWIPNRESIYVPENIIEISAMAFRECRDLKEITFAKSIANMGWSIDMDSHSLEKITVLDENPTEIGEDVFECYSTATLIVPVGTKDKYKATGGWSKFQNIIELGSGQDAQYWMELESTLQYADDVYGRARNNSNVDPWMLEELSEFMNRGSNMLDERTADEEEVRHMIEEISWICWEIEEAMNRQGGAEPYAIFIDNNTALEFRYDDQRSAYPDAMDIYPFSSTVDRGWHDMAESIHSVVFNESFANCTSITSTEYWFFGCSNLETFIGLENLNTSNVTNMASMFDGCYSLTSLDLSSFNTTSVTEMKMMFYGCTNLTTIYVRSGWSTANVRSSDYMFEGCDRIVGGRGTQWDPDHVDAAYAHVDGGANNPGYLTDPYAEPSGEGEARFDGLTAWVYGDKTLDDAFAEVGRSEALKTIAAIVWEGDGALTADQMQGITNPNLLVYVNEASKAPAGVQNIIVNGSAAQIVLTDASGNNNFHCPQSFTAQSISYTRNFSQTTEIGVCRGWETIALPFNVQSISHSHGALVPFGGGNGGYPFWLHQLQDNSLSPVTVMEANTPYLICMPNNKVYPSTYNQAGNVTFASSNVTVPETHPHEGFAGNVMLIPAFQSVEASPDIYTLNVGEASGSYAEGSVFISNYRSVRPFQAYTVHTNGARGEDIRYIPLTTLGGGTDGTTGIMEILQPVGSDAGAWYSLDGRKLDAKPTRKGVYIQNGKKIVIK